MRLLQPNELQSSSVVANCTMNRERRLTGTYGYERELGLEILALLRDDRSSGTWVDLCCGTGRALIEAAELLQDRVASRVRIEGIDLAGLFNANPCPDRLTLRRGELESWSPTGPYALVTSVHGFHYLGDKLAAIAKSVARLSRNGLFVASLDLANFRWENGSPAARQGASW